METEKRMFYILEAINELNEIIKKGNEAREERDKLRKEISIIMESYVETVNEMP